MRLGPDSSRHSPLWWATVSSLGTVFLTGAAIAVLVVLIDRELASAADLSDGAFVVTGSVGEEFRHLPMSLGAWSLVLELAGMLVILAFSFSGEARSSGATRPLTSVSCAGLALLFGLTGFTLRGHLTTHHLIVSGSEVLPPVIGFAHSWEAAYPAMLVRVTAVLAFVGLVAVLVVYCLAGRSSFAEADGEPGRGPLARQRLTVSMSVLAAALAALPISWAELGNLFPAYVVWACSAAAGLLCYLGVKNAGLASRTIRLTRRRRVVSVAVMAVLVVVLSLVTVGSSGRIGFPLERPIAQGLPVGELAVIHVVIVAIGILAVQYSLYQMSYSNDLAKPRLRAEILVLERKRLGDLDKAANLLAGVRDRALRYRGRPYLEYMVTYLCVLTMRYQCSGRPEHLDEALELIYGELGLYDAVISSGQRGWKDAPASAIRRHRVLETIAFTLFHAHTSSGSTTYLADAIKISSYLFHKKSRYDLFSYDSTRHLFAICSTMMYLADPDWDIDGELSKQHPTMGRLQENVSLLAFALYLSSAKYSGVEEQAERLQPLIAIGLPQLVGYMQTDDADLLNEAIAKYETSHTRDHHYMYALIAKAMEEGDVDGLENVLAVGKDLLGIDRARHIKADVLTAAGEAAWYKYALTADPDDFNAARAYFEQARDETDAPAHTRLGAVLRWAGLNEMPLDDSSSPGTAAGPGLRSSLAAYESAVNLLPSLNLLVGSAGTLSGIIRRDLRFPREAVPVAAELGELERAVEFFELGQLVVQEQFVLPEMEAHATSTAGLNAEELRRIRARLEGVESRGDLLHATSGLFDAMRYRAEQRVRHIRELEHMLGDSQSGASLLGGFDQLAAAAAQGPVVLFNLTGERGDALIVTREHRVRHARLGTEVTSATVARLAHELDECLEGGDERAANDLVENLNRWLWNHVVGPAVERIDGIDPHKPGSSRVWLCPTGPLARMPLATALGPFGLRLLDMAVPMQTTSLRTLLDLRERRAPSRDELLPAFVGVPPRPGAPESGAPGWEGELELMERVLPEVDGRIGAEANVSAFEDLLRSRHWLHLACHCSTLSGTGKVGIALTDREVTAEEILAVGEIEARYAMLPICGAARTAAGAADETLHPAGALYRAGVPHVVGTLWRVYDHRDPERSKAYQMTRAFYDALERQSAKEPPNLPLAYRDALAHLTATAKDDIAHWCAFVCMSA